MTQSTDEVGTTTATISVDVARKAKIYAAQNGTSIRAIIDSAVPEWIDRKSAAAAPSLQEPPVAAKG